MGFLAMDDDRCPGCGRPKAVHAQHPRWQEYGVEFYACPALEARERARSTQAKKDEPLTKKGIQPEHWRFWSTVTATEKALREFVERWTDN